MNSTVAEPSQADLQRYFAVEANNRAWDLAVKERSRAEDDEMLNAAHAAAWHWRAVGSEVNWMRATMLLAEVHALLGLGETALRYAREMHSYFATYECPDWELAFAESILAHAAATAGDLALHRSAYRVAEVAVKSIADPDERRLVEETFHRVPAPE